jgi:hypothetical protein
MNMSYCRFQNTLTDLMDCWDAIQEEDELSTDEARAKAALVRVCREIVAFEEEQEETEE